MLPHLRFASALAIGAAFFCSAAAQAADNTRYISITGNNANACTVAAPCRTLHKGISVTPVGGELQILESGFYGNNATVNKSMTVNGNGHTVYLGVPLTVDAAGATVALRGLTLDGQGTVFQGIQILAAATAHIERCVIHGYTNAGIASTAPDGEVFVLDTISRDNGTGYNYAIQNGTQRVTIDNSRFENNGGQGVLIQSGRAAITRSIASGNAGNGILGLSGSPIIVVRDTTAADNGGDGFRVSIGTISVVSSLAYGNAGGLGVSSGSLARVSNSTFTGNVTGISNQGTVRTLGNNVVDGNGNDAVGGTEQAVTLY